ncbi:MAG: nitrogenase-stabilizing/protective protein NifW [Nitrospirae bacterium]|nr:nitrogenase-stabilizing/protective protein NifW [Nitrospirota bacterium]
MNATLDKLDHAIDAEDFFALFELDYDPQVVRVNRLHILKKFALLKNEIDAGPGGLATDERYRRYRDALARAYATFLERTAHDERLFKVFQNPVPGVISIATLTGKQ